MAEDCNAVLLRSCFSLPLNLFDKVVPAVQRSEYSLIGLTHI